MTRFAPVALLLLTAAVTVAAPVPKPGTPDQAEMERLWKQFQSGSDLQRTESLCRFLAKPDDAVQLFAAKLRPLKMTKKEAERWVKRLGSDDEQEWKGAYDTLLTFDPRLALSLEDCWALAKSDDHKRRLAWVLCGEVIEGTEESVFELVPPSRQQKYLELQWQPKSGTRPEIPNFGSRCVAKDMTELCDDHAEWVKWFAETQAVGLLGRINTPTAWQLVEEMATGHKEAGPTRNAKWVLERRKLGKLAERGYSERTLAEQQERDWDSLKHLVNSEERIEAVMGFVLDKPVESVVFFKKRLPPLKLEKKRADELVTKLFSAKDAEWREAVAEFTKTDIRLAYSVPDAWNLTSDADQRARMAMVLHHDGAHVIDDLLYCDVELKADGNGLFGNEPGSDRSYLYFTTTWKPNIPKAAAERLSVTSFDIFAPGDFTTLNERIWHRHQSAVYILDAIGTGEALAILKDMATGHPDAGPTQAAKAVLKRRGNK